MIHASRRWRRTSKANFRHRDCDRLTHIRVLAKSGIAQGPRWSMLGGLFHYVK